MNIDSFVHFITENFSPTGIVYSTAKAKNIILKSNLSPAEFLRPFGFLPKLTYNNEISSFVISDFRLDFYDSEYYQKIPISQYSTIINRILSSEKYLPKIPEINLNNININSNIKLTDRIIDKLNEFSFPWFSTYIKTIIELIKFNEYELYQQPLCSIYICSIDDNPNDIMPKLSNKKKIPSLIYEGIYEPDMPILIIIIHDKLEEKKITPEEKNEYINGFKNLYKNYYLLYWELNDIETNNKKDLDEASIKFYSGDIWSKYEHIVEKYYYNYNKETQMKNNEENNIKGKYISIYSRKRFHQTFMDFFEKYAMQKIQLKQNLIEKKVLEAKKSFRNTIFSFFKQDQPQMISYNKAFQIYSLSNTEFLEYFYSTLCFFFKDYRQCKEVSNIFMNDIKKKSPEHYNAAFELNKLSYFLYNHYNKKNGLEFNELYKDEDAFETFSNYIKNEDYFQACRALFSGMKIHEQNLTILQLTSILSDVVPYIPGLQNKEDSLYVHYIYPLINEQIAVYFAILDPIKKRKFLWYIYQAALRYKKEINNSHFLVKYALNDFLLMSDFLEKNDKKSFLMTKFFIFEQMEFLFKEINNEQGMAICLLRNIINYINLLDEKKKLYEENIQIKYNNLIKILLALKESNNNDNILFENEFLNNLPFPEIDNSSIQILEEQDILINNIYRHHNKTNSNWKYFDKYDYIPYKKNFLCLTPPDIQSLVNLDNIIQNKQNFSNFFNKRKFNINLNKKIYVNFRITNPFNFDLNISYIKLICEFKSKKEINIELNNEIISDINGKSTINEENEHCIFCEEKNFVLNKNDSIYVQFYVQGNKEGKIIIKGVELILENCIKIKHYFNRKNKLNLYSHIKKPKRKKSSIDYGIVDSPSSTNDFENWPRKGSSSSQNSIKSKSSNNSYKTRHKYKEDITCEIKNNNNDIIISFPYGTELKLYKNELFLMPIKITNNSNIKIKQFCFYLYDDNNDIEQSCILNELIYKEIEISNNKENKDNEKIIYVPLIPKKEGKMFLKVLFKFEEEKTINDYEIQRFVIVLNVQNSFCFNIKEIVHKYISDFIHADLNVICNINQTDDNDFPLEELIINEKINFSNIYEQIIPKTKSISKQSKLDEQNKTVYTKYTIKKKTQNALKVKKDNNIINNKNSNKNINNEIKSFLENKNFDFLEFYDFINLDKTQSHIKYDLCKLLLKEFIIFNWSAKEKKSNRYIKGIFIYKPKLIFSLYLNRDFTNFIKNLITMKHNINKMNDVTICTIDISIDYNYYNQLENVKGIEIFINTDNDNFEKVKWLGLKKYKLNKINDNYEKEKEIHFSCLILKNGIYDINQISILAHFYFSRNEKKLFNKILSPIIVKVG